MGTQLDGLYKQLHEHNGIKLVEWVFFGIILVGIIIKIFSFNVYSTVTQKDLQLGIVPSGHATGSVWGYSIILFAVMGLIFISVNPQEKELEQIKNIPYGLYGIIIILLWSIVLNVRFYTTINMTQNMPSEYNVWNNWSIITIILLSILSGIDFLIKKTNMTEASINLKYQINIYSIIVFFAAIIVLGIQQSILENFLVDG